MTETSRCLDSHPKFLCTVGASIFGLQAHGIQRHFHEAGNFKDSSVIFCCVLQNVLQTLS
ncbi:hypothetical protein ACRRTK_005917 [Alexandromys fortis]